MLSLKHLQLGGHSTLFTLEIPSLEYQEELEKFTSAREMRTEYQSSLRSLSSDPSLDVLLLRAGCVELVCSTRQPLVAFSNIASHKCLITAPKLEKSFPLLLSVPIGNDITLKFQDSQELLEYVEERKNQNLLAQQATSLLPPIFPPQLSTPQAAPSLPSVPHAALAAPQPSVPKATEATLKPIVDCIVQQVGALNTRPHTVQYFQDEDEEEPGHWMADITWSSKNMHDWVAVLVYHNGLQVGTENRQTHKWIPYLLGWDNVLVSSILPLLENRG